MQKFVKKQEPIEAFIYEGTRASAEKAMSELGSAVSWDRGACFVSTVEGQRRLGRGDAIMAVEGGLLVIEGPAFRATYDEAPKSLVDRILS